MPDPISVAFSVDALTPRLTGIGRYCLELSRGLRAAPEIDRVFFFRANQWFDDPEVLLDENWQLPRGRWRKRIAHWRGRAKARGAVVHGPNYFLPSWAKSGILTVHDLSVLLYPETHPLERVKDFERRFQDSLNRARAIITDSETVRQEVIDKLGWPEDRVVAVPLGLCHSPGNGSSARSTGKAALAAFGLIPNHYTLCVSTLEPRKRINHLIAAYAQLKPDLRRTFPLVLAGASGWGNDELNAQIDAAQAAGWLRRLDFVSDHARDALYKGARLFVYPSLYEGFGLPPLEAMLNGVPTVVGDAATLVEVTRGGARVSNVEDCEGFAADLAEALLDEDWRNTAMAAGRRVAESYTWRNCIAGTIAVYQKFAAE